MKNILYFLLLIIIGSQISCNGCNSNEPFSLTALDDTDLETEEKLVITNQINEYLQQLKEENPDKFEDIISSKSKLFSSAVTFGISGIDAKLDDNVSNALTKNFRDTFPNLAKGIIFPFAEINKTITDSLFSNSGTFNSLDSFYIYFENTLMDSTTAHDPNISKQIINGLNKNHKKEYSELKQQYSNDSIILANAFVNKISSVAKLCYKQNNKIKTIRNYYHAPTGKRIGTIIDLGAICPPICPKDSI